MEKGVGGGVIGDIAVSYITETSHVSALFIGCGDEYNRTDTTTGGHFAQEMGLFPHTVTSDNPASYIYTYTGVHAARQQGATASVILRVL